MKRLLALALVLSLAGAPGAVAGVCGGATASRSHCCCHPGATGDAVANPCQCRVAPQPTQRTDSLPSSLSGPDRTDHGALAPVASAVPVHAAARILARGPAAPSPPGSPSSYLFTHSFRC
jgi:hypothetical protein